MMGMHAQLIVAELVPSLSSADHEAGLRAWL